MMPMTTASVDDVAPAALADDGFSNSEKKIDCNDVPPAYVGFSAHSSPLGFEYFDSSNDNPALKDSFLVALHGSSKRSLRRGYSLMRVRKGGSVQDFITGFLQNGRVYGRPADVMSMGKDAFLFTDDYAGVVYCVCQKGRPQSAPNTAEIIRHHSLRFVAPAS